MSFKTPQETFWASSFGDEYCKRSNNARIAASRTAMLSGVLGRTTGIETVIEFGPNVGLNLRALQQLLPDSTQTAVEINATAVEELKKIQGIEVIHKSLLEFTPDRQWDFVLISGVLIHINPDALDTIYEILYKSAARYICLSEYYNPKPVTVEYRGHEDRLFKRDFAGDLMDKYPDLKLLDYRFIYHRDPVFPADDVTWFLLEKTAGE